MHIAVAPRCNISCKYCIRKFDCVNESRPGVSSTVLNPEEALARFKVTRDHLDTLTVVGIAGPGDALANRDAVLETFRLIRKEDPRITFCLATNGLLLPRFISELVEAGVSHITVTVNAVDPKIGAQIYAHAVIDGVAYSSEQGAGLLISNQLRGIELAVERGLCVKVNTVLIPGVNDHHAEEVARTAARLGATCQNVTGMIPVPGSAFEHMPAMTPEKLDAARTACAKHLRQIYHCRQCRADAIGLLGNDLSATIDRLCRELATTKRIAVATRGGTLVDTHFGHAERFLVFDVDESSASFRESRTVTRYCEGANVCEGLAEKDDEGKSLPDGLSILEDCHAVLCTRIGPGPAHLLAEQGIRAFDASRKHAPTIREACSFGEIDSALRAAYATLCAKTAQTLTSDACAPSP